MVEVGVQIAAAVEAGAKHGPCSQRHRCWSRTCVSLLLAPSGVDIHILLQKKNCRKKGTSPNSIPSPLALFENVYDKQEPTKQVSRMGIYDGISPY